MQKILTIILAIAIIYIALEKKMDSVVPQQEKLKEHYKPTQENDLNSKQDGVENTAEMSGNFLEKSASKLLMNVLKTDEGRKFVENLIQPQNKPLQDQDISFKMNNDKFLKSIFQINTFDKGTEGPASCGQIVSIHYKILNTDNVVLEDKVDTFRLGSGKIAPGLDAIIVGMKTGQTRHATISNKYFNETANDKTSIFKVNLLLKKIMPKNFIGDEVKVFDDKMSYTMPLLCSNRAIFDVKITKLQNAEVLYNSEDSGKKIDMVIGSLNYPAIFSYSLHNKTPEGKRTVIAPGRVFKSYLSEFSVIFPETNLDKNEYFMIEFFNFEKP